MSIPASHADLLETTALAHVATIGPDGLPQNNPVWFGWDGTHVLFSQTTGRQKYRNPQANPAVALSIVDSTNPYRYLEIRGTVVEIVYLGSSVRVEDMREAYWVQRYNGARRAPEMSTAKSEQLIKALSGSAEAEKPGAAENRQ